MDVELCSVDLCQFVAVCRTPAGFVMIQATDGWHAKSIPDDLAQSYLNLPAATPGLGEGRRFRSIDAAVQFVRQVAWGQVHSPSRLRDRLRAWFYRKSR